MKPDWKDAPEWANWLAMDQSGHWYWHESEPSLGNVLWRDTGRYMRACNEDAWKKSLEKRP